MTITANNLALMVINDGNGLQCGMTYKDRCELVTQRRNNPNKWVQLINCAELWLHQRGETNHALVSEKLAAAAQVAAYYENHIKELNNAA